MPSSMNVKGSFEIFHLNTLHTFVTFRYFGSATLHDSQPATNEPMIDVFHAHTDIVSKTFAGTSVHNFLHNRSIVFLKD